MIRRPPRSTLFPYTRSSDLHDGHGGVVGGRTQLFSFCRGARQGRRIVLEGGNIPDKVNIALRIDAGTQSPIQCFLITDIDVLINQINELLPEVESCQRTSDGHRVPSVRPLELDNQNRETCTSTSNREIA